MAAPFQNTAGPGAQRKHMPRADDIRGLGSRRNGGADGGDTVGRRHAGGHAFAGFDRYREGRAVAALVVGNHGRQAQVVQRFIGQAQAHDSAAVANQLGHDGHGEFVGGYDEIGLVLAVVVVHQDDGPPETQVLQCARQAHFEGLRVQIGGKVGYGRNYG